MSTRVSESSADVERWFREQVARLWPAALGSLSLRRWKVDQTDPLARGEYLAVTAGCRFCHTPPAQECPFLDQENTAEFFAGGRRIRRKDFLVFSANISPDRRTGIGKWTSNEFVKRFKDYKDTRIPVTAMGYATEHAWTEYAEMSEEDLNAIYTYLMTQQPIVNKVRSRSDRRPQSG